VKTRYILIVILLVQGVTAYFFVSDTLSSLIGFSTRPISWHLRELIDIGAIIGLILGLILGAFSLWSAEQGRRQAVDRLKLASGAFMEVLHTRFDTWALTPAERDVALFAIKGLSTTEIAGLRNTSTGTVKAQTNAIYRKAGVTGRSQLLSLFIDELMGDGIVPKTGSKPAGKPWRIRKS